MIEQTVDEAIIMLKKDGLDTEENVRFLRAHKEPESLAAAFNLLRRHNY